MKKGHTTETSNKHSSQKSSNNAVPGSTKLHKHPESQNKPKPVAGQVGKGGKIK